MMGYSLGMDIRQVGADYATRYCYGERGTLELETMVRRIPVDQKAIVPEHIQILAGVELDELISPGFWNDIKGLVQTLENTETKLFAYSVSYNTIDQVRKLRRNDKLKETLSTHFIYKRIGTFDTWQRR